jgi:signal recognition particle GTPase
MREYTLNDLAGHLRYLENCGHPVLQDTDGDKIKHLLALIDSLTQDERSKPRVVLSSRSRWDRALHGSGARDVSPKSLRKWLDRMTTIINEIR